METERAPADKLPVSQRIDSRVENHPLRRKMTPTDWAIKGELFLNCSCTVFCPCVVSLGAHPPNVGLLVDIPGRMGEGNWRVAAYVDERSTQKAYNGLLKIFSGAAGGTTGLFTFLVSEIIGAEREKVEITREGTKRGLYIGRKIAGEIEMIDGGNPDHPVMITNSKYWMGPDIIAAKGLKSKVRDYGRVWDFGGMSAEICPIDWKGPKP